MTPKRAVAYVGLMAVVGGGIFAGRSVLASRQQAAYHWYGAAQTDSVRTLLNAYAPGTVLLKLEERTKDHIWVGVMRADSAVRVAGSFEVEESFPCPPLCR